MDGQPENTMPLLANCQQRQKSHMAVHWCTGYKLKPISVYRQQSGCMAAVINMMIGWYYLPPGYLPSTEHLVWTVMHNSWQIRLLQYQKKIQNKEKTNRILPKILPLINVLMAQRLLVHTAFHDMQHCHQQDFLLPMHTDPTKHQTYTNYSGTGS